MLLLELIEWTYEHWGEVSISALLLFVLRKFVMSELQKLLHFGRDAELEWTRRKVEELTGEKWNGPRPILNHIQTRYFKRYYSSSRKGTNRGNPLQKRRNNMQNINWITLLPALVGALKLILQPFGVDLSHITDQQVNDVANGIAALLTIIGVLLPHRKGGVSNGPTISADGNK